MQADDSRAVKALFYVFITHNPVVRAELIHEKPHSLPSPLFILHNLRPTRQHKTPVSLRKLIGYNVAVLPDDRIRHARFPLYTSQFPPLWRTVQIHHILTFVINIVERNAISTAIFSLHRQKSEVSILEQLQRTLFIQQPILSPHSRIIVLHYSFFCFIQAKIHQLPQFCCLIL